MESPENQQVPSTGGPTAMDRLRALLAPRLWWMNVLMAFCAYMTFIYMPFDLFIKPVAEDEEVWLGFVLHGWWAKATAPLHWLIYAAGFWGFLKMRSWMWPWAGVYSAQVAIAMLVWAVNDPGGRGAVSGLIAFAIFCIPTVALLMAWPRFGWKIEKV